MLKNILFLVSALVLARAQIPSLGWCPEYVPMANFDMGKFLGVWYEAERYFQILDPVSRCVTANYTKGSDGKYRVSNEVTNRFTGVKRVLDGEITTPATKTEEGKLHVKYTTVPLTPETQYAVLETDYKSYAVLWSCSGIGPINAQNAWLMTRARKAENAILQKAYGVLDKYKISRTFFVKTNQEDCAWFDENPSTTKPSESATVEVPVVVEEPVVEEQGAKEIVNMRSAIVPETIDEDNVETLRAVPEPEKVLESKPQNAEPVEAAAIEENEKELNSVEKPAESAVVPVSSVPEIILKAADRAKEIVKKTIDDVKKFETFENPGEKIQEALEKPVEKIQEALEKPVEKIQEALEKPIEQIKETFQKPLDKIREVLNIPAPESKENLTLKKTDQPKKAIDDGEKKTSEKKIES